MVDEIKEKNSNNLDKLRDQVISPTRTEDFLESDVCPSGLMSPVPPVPEPRNQKPKIINLEKPLAKPKQVIHKIEKNESKNNNNNDEKKPSIPPKPELLPPSITSRILLESTSKMDNADFLSTYYVLLPH